MPVPKPSVGKPGGGVSAWCQNFRDPTKEDHESCPGWHKGSMGKPPEYRWICQCKCHIQTTCPKCGQLIQSKVMT